MAMPLATLFNELPYNMVCFCMNIKTIRGLSLTLRLMVRKMHMFLLIFLKQPSFFGRISQFLNPLWRESAAKRSKILIRNSKIPPKFLVGAIVRSLTENLSI